MSVTLTDEMFQVLLREATHRDDAAIAQISRRLEGLERLLTDYLRSTAYDAALRRVAAKAGADAIPDIEQELLGELLATEVRRVLADHSSTSSRALVLEALTAASQRELANVAKEVAVESLAKDGDDG